MKPYNRNRAKPWLKPNIWIRYRVNGKEVAEPGKGSERSTNAWMAELKRQIRNGTWVHPSERKTGATTFAGYGPIALRKRVEAGRGASESPPGKSERGHFANHLVPVFGHLLLRDLTFQAIRVGFAKIATKGLGGSTVTNVYCTLVGILREALDDRLIEDLPARLTVDRGHLPPIEDTREDGWRDDAVFEMEELQALASTTHDQIPSAHLIMLLAYFLTGSRFIEIVPLRVGDYARKRKPLGCLTVVAVKQGRQRGAKRRRRQVPVHPDLAAWLSWWLDVEYEILFGHPPRPTDLLFPTISFTRRAAGLETVSHGELYKRWQRNYLPALGLRHRRLHDARRTLLSALKNAGVDDTVRRKFTHWSVADVVLDGYTTLEWRLLCEAMLCVQWDLPNPRDTREPMKPNATIIVRGNRGRLIPFALPYKISADVARVISNTAR